MLTPTEPLDRLEARVKALEHERDASLVVLCVGVAIFFLALWLW